MNNKFTIAKHEKEEDWAKSKYIPKRGEVIVFEYEDAPKIKIGDGRSNVNELPFATVQTNAVARNDILYL